MNGFKLFAGLSVEYANDTIVLSRDPPGSVVATIIGIVSDDDDLDRIAGIVGKVSDQWGR